jgi:hypothetical protein
MVFRSKLCLGAAALMLLSGAALASDSADDDSLEFGSPIAHAALDERRAGDGRLEFNLQETNATLRDNTAIHTTNGANTISDGAFSHASGLPAAVQNSGNNVIIQNAVILNLNVQ